MSSSHQVRKRKRAPAGRLKLHRGQHKTAAVRNPQLIQVGNLVFMPAGASSLHLDVEIFRNKVMALTFRSPPVQDGSGSKRRHHDPGEDEQFTGEANA